MNPRVFITTERLRLRVLQPEDLRVVQEAIHTSLPELARWMPRAIKGQTQRQTRNYIYTQLALFVEDENYVFGIFDKDDASFLGVVELGPRVPQIPSYELGFWIRSDVAGEGLMTEAVRAVTGYAFEKMRAGRVFMRCEPDNIGSRKVAEKSGLLQEGWLKNDALGADGREVVDTLVYGQVPAGWARVKGDLSSL
ncbi:MAG: GNAT family N-acetyltransferase [Alphaproteobacteria bacterium CG_4_10_14_0_8_um_filter_53_9]|nr:MAG: GNAT family N-acetyltransferase [Alphaproteobacteria bacterium CG_4_10_14_0_8_um_filter_53_9]